PYRHMELRRRLQGVSQRMLTRSLRNLESAGLVARIVTQSKAIAVEYSLTQLGRTIIAPLAGMCRWGRTISQGRERGSATSGSRNRVRKNLRGTYPPRWATRNS